MRRDCEKGKEVKIVKLDSGFFVRLDPERLDGKAHAFERFESMSDFLEKELQ